MVFDNFKGLLAEGLDCYRLYFPKGMDTNEYACQEFVEIPTDRFPVMEGDQPTVIVNDEGARTTPSVVGFGKEGERLVVL